MTPAVRRPRRARAARAALALVFFPLAGAACTGGGSGAPRAVYAESSPVAAPEEGYGAMTSQLAIARFLDSAQEEDYRGMWSVFGTERGAAIDEYGVQEVEARMVVLSRLLKHQSYQMKSANLAGLGENRARYEVLMRGTRKGNVMVPFVTAHDSDGRWYVERLEAQRLSSSGLN